MRPWVRRLLCSAAPPSERPTTPLHDLLIYSSDVPSIFDSTIKRSQIKLMRQKELQMQEEIQKMRAALENREESNLSVAVPFIYGGSTLLRQGVDTVEPEEIVEVTADEDAAGVKQSPVYPFGLFRDPGDISRTPLLPTGELTEGGDDTSRKKRGRGRGRRRTHEEDQGRPDTEEPLQLEKSLSKDELFRYGSSDPTIPASEVPCGGCGALLHCNDPKMPGFVPVEMFEDKSPEALRLVSCQRCHILREYNVALKVSVPPDKYTDTIRHLHTKRALVLLIVDLLDFPGSVWPGILDLLGTNKRIILVGNKTDLLPQDSPDYLKRIHKSMREVFLEKCNNGLITHDPNMVSSVLVSARTGFHIERLIDIIYSSWHEGRRIVGSDIYLVGTTNVGKSSIFNALLESDLCKVKAIDQVEKALTSPIPGTTLNLLKFPVMRPDPSRLNERLTRVKRSMKEFTQRERDRIELLRKHRHRKYSVLRGPVELTFAYHRDKQLPLTGGSLALERRNPQVTLPQRLDPTDPDFAHGRWCYDTPGTVSEDQVIQLLTQDEVNKLIPHLPLQPRTFTFRNGQSLFIGGLARLDLLEGPFAVHPMLVTVFCSDDLPINMVRTADAEEFYRKALAADFLRVPRGDPIRLRDFPPLEGKDFEVDSVDYGQSSCDIVFSSAGWVTCNTGVGRMAGVKAWTPGGRGLYLRDPPFLPFASQLKGKRIGGTPSYKPQIYIPRY